MIARLLFLILLLTLHGCTQSSQVTVLKLAHGLNTEHPVHAAMVHMADEVKRLSQGRMRIDIYPGEQLGSEREALELVQLGIIAMAKASAAPLEGFIPKMGVLGLPYLFRDDAHMWAVFNGPLGQEILAAGEARGLKGLCFYDAGARSFYTTNKAIRTPADLEGMKIRVQKSNMAVEMIKAMGGSPTPIDWGELYSALQQGVIDGAENNPPSFHLSRHYDTCPYYTLDEHLRQPDILLINPDIYQSLSKEQQAILKKAVKSSVEFQRKLWKDKVKAGMAAIKKAGIKVIRPDKKPFLKAVQPLWKTFDGTPIGDLARRIQAVQVPPVPKAQ